MYLHSETMHKISGIGFELLTRKTAQRYGMIRNWLQRKWRQFRVTETVDHVSLEQRRKRGCSMTL